MLCPILCNPMDCIMPGSSVHGILQARILEWITVPFSRGSSKLRGRTQVSHIVGGFFTRIHLPAMRETWVPSLGWEDPLEKRTVTLSSILAWRIPWTEEPGRLQSMGCKELDTTEQFSPSLFTVLCRHEEKKRHTLCSWDVCSLTQQFHSPTAPHSLCLSTYYIYF